MIQYRASIHALLVLLSASAVAQPKFANSNAITPERLRSHLEFVASDELEGRETPSRGLDIATKYVVSQLKLWGAQPGGEKGTFFQSVPFRQPILDPDKSSIVLGEKTFVYGGGLQSSNMYITAKGPMVYVGHGYSFKKKGIDPFAGLDLKGKILVVARGLPKGATFADMVGEEGVDYMWPTLAAKKYGAVGVIMIADAFQSSFWDRDYSLRLGSPEFDDPKTDGPLNAVGVVTVGPEVAHEIFKGEAISAEEVLKGDDAPETPVQLSETKELSVNVVPRTLRLTAQNVIAIIPGSDPKLRDEYVAYGCHIDHLGKRPNGTNDRIFNGADDDGSGVVALLEIAHALLTGPRPKRSSILVWHVGEEMGMVGSRWFTDHPTVDLKKIVAQLNIDMIGRTKNAGDTKAANQGLTGPNEVYVVGSTMMSTDLHRLSESVNAKFLRMAFNYKYDDPKDPDRIFYRSDHYMYARKGIPIVFYYSGQHVDYHRPTDEVARIDFEKVTKIARTVYATGWFLGNAKSRPEVDKPLKENPAGG